MSNHDPEIVIEFSQQHIDRIYSIGANLMNFKEKILAGEEIAFLLYPLTKTNLDTHLCCGFGGMSMNPEVEGFKLDNKNHCFKLLKSQGAEEYKRYLKAVIQHMEGVLGIQIPQRKFTVHTYVFKEPASAA